MAACIYYISYDLGELVGGVLGAREPGGPEFRAMRLASRRP